MPTEPQPLPGTGSAPTAAMPRVGQAPVLVPLDGNNVGMVEYACQRYREGLEWVASSVVESQFNPLTALSAPDSVWWILANLEAGRMYGLAGFEKINWIDRVCEPYIAIEPASRRVRLGSVMGEMLRRHAVMSLNMRRIQTGVLAGAPSETILKRMGFMHEGTRALARYKNGELHDVRLYAWMKE